MRDKINRLARDITNLETPLIKISPEFLKVRLYAGRISTVVIELNSLNGYGIRAACYTDNPRVSFERDTYAGRRLHVAVEVNAVGLCEGGDITGDIYFITNAGEFCVRFCFDLEGIAGETGEDQPYLAENTRVVYAGPKENEGGAHGSRDAVFPDDEDVFKEMLADLIRAKDESAFAFSVYKEAIKRRYSITYLYESYVWAYPEESSEEMPREVLLYFSYDNEIAAGMAEKIYANIILYQNPASELYESYAPRMSAFAMSQALSGRMNKRLVLIYGAMIYEGMLDQKAAAALPDILKCREVRIDSGAASFLTVSYKEVYGSVRAKIVNNLAYVPVYFDDASLRFYDESVPSVEGMEAPLEVTDNIHFTLSPLFNKEELLQRCYDFNPSYGMHVLSICRDIAETGISSLSERDAAMEALRNLDLRPAFRAVLIRALSGAGGDMKWLDLLTAEDYSTDNCRAIFKAFLGAGRFSEAYWLIKQYGFECAESGGLKVLAENLAGQSLNEMSNDLSFIKLCRKLFDEGLAGASVLEALCINYSSSVGLMTDILRAAEEKGVPLHLLPERILSFGLFTGVSFDIDYVFRSYAGNCRHDDALVRAYLVVRSQDYFLKSKKVDEEVFFPALYSYLNRADGPEKLPYILSIALTAYFAGKEELDAGETKLCQKLADGLIAGGLVFRHIKRLRKKINIPEEISWKYYIEYRGTDLSRPRLMVQILPDDDAYRAEDMKRVYKDVYVYQTVLFTGDELHYRVYDDAKGREAVQEGKISIVKLHENGDDRMRFINGIMDSIRRKDIKSLKEGMLSYVEYSETLRELFIPENI